MRPASVEQYEQLLQRQQINLQARHADQITNIRTSVSNAVLAQRTLGVSVSSVGESNEQEIPDNVTAELEKLEQEGTMVDLQGVSEILGGLEDDDELLGEIWFLL